MDVTDCNQCQNQYNFTCNIKIILATHLKKKCKSFVVRDKHKEITAIHVSKRKLYGTECKNCGHRKGVHFVNIFTGKESCDGYVRKDQPNFDGKKCNCKHYEKF